jgi:predicted glycogen debranching enzyme
MEYTFHFSAGSGMDAGLSSEWLLSNARGDYASGTARGCATRRYHGLLCAQTPEGKLMLLSSLEDCVRIQGREYPLSCRLHPGTAWPEGWKLESRLTCSMDEVSRVFRLPLPGGGCVFLRRSIKLCAGECRLLVRYELLDTPGASSCGNAELFARPLVSCRPADHLHHADPSFAGSLHPLAQGDPHPGFSLRPHASIPPLVMEMSGTGMHGPSFEPAPDWYYHILYPVERERGYDWEDDLFMPGVFACSLGVGSPAWISAGTAPLADAPGSLWKEVQAGSPLYEEPVLEHLRRECSRFLIENDGEALVPAGYHWFGPWGRDTFIALPGLTFLSGRIEQGKKILAQVGKQVRGGLVPNLMGNGNGGASYNSADASLWYILAVQRMAEGCPGEADFVRQECWPVVKDILAHFARGTMADGQGGMLVRTDPRGLLHVGNAQTQLTWMDASIEGVPVTPRHGCAVEMNALWFNALEFARTFAQKCGEVPPSETDIIPVLRKEFRRVFIPPAKDRAAMGGGLYDTWSPESGPSLHIRPNQVIAAALPFSPLSPRERTAVTTCVRKHLLTPYGLRTLSPADPSYRPRCKGGQKERDMAYHQGTVWPWLLGFYAEALWRGGYRDRKARELLQTVSPLFEKHLGEAGLGSISEIFDGDAPHEPGGCIAQAWSVAEALRLLLLVRREWPEAWKNWAAALPCGSGATGGDTTDTENAICVF